MLWHLLLSWSAVPTRTGIDECVSRFIGAGVSLPCNHRSCVETQLRAQIAKSDQDDGVAKLEKRPILPFAKLRAPFNANAGKAVGGSEFANGAPELTDEAAMVEFVLDASVLEDDQTSPLHECLAKVAEDAKAAAAVAKRSGQKAKRGKTHAGSSSTSTASRHRPPQVASGKPGGGSCPAKGGNGGPSATGKGWGKGRAPRDSPYCAEGGIGGGHAEPRRTGIAASEKGELTVEVDGSVKADQTRLGMGAVFSCPVEDGGKRRAPTKLSLAAPVPKDEDHDVPTGFDGEFGAALFALFVADAFARGLRQLNIFTDSQAMQHMMNFVLDPHTNKAPPKIPEYVPLVNLLVDRVQALLDKKVGITVDKLDRGVNEKADKMARSMETTPGFGDSLLRQKLIELKSWQRCAPGKEKKDARDLIVESLLRSPPRRLSSAVDEQSLPAPAPRDAGAADSSNGAVSPVQGESSIDGGGSPIGAQFGSAGVGAGSTTSCVPASADQLYPQPQEVSLAGLRPPAVPPPVAVAVSRRPPPLPPTLPPAFPKGVSPPARPPPF